MKILNFGSRTNETDEAKFNSFHVGRNPEGTEVENNCPCFQELCGLVNSTKIDPACSEHPGNRIFQSHRNDKCPGAS